MNESITHGSGKVRHYSLPSAPRTFNSIFDKFHNCMRFKFSAWSKRKCAWKGNHFDGNCDNESHGNIVEMNTDLDLVRCERDVRCCWVWMSKRICNDRRSYLVQWNCRPVRSTKSFRQIHSIWDPSTSHTKNVQFKWIEELVFLNQQMRTTTAVFYLFNLFNIRCKIHSIFLRSFFFFFLFLFILFSLIGLSCKRSDCRLWARTFLKFRTTMEQLKKSEQSKNAKLGPVQSYNAMWYVPLISNGKRV